LKISGGIFEREKIIERLDFLKKEMELSSFWNDQKKAKKIIKEKNHLNNIHSTFEELLRKFTKRFNN